MSTRLGTVKKYAPAPLLLLVAVTGWEVFVAATQPPAFILPAPSTIASTFAENIPLLAEHAAVTMKTAGLGLIIGSSIGVFLAIMMSLVPAVRSAIYPIVLGSQTTPKIAIAPLLIVWFGVGLAPKLVIVSLLTFFPVLINVLAGIDGTDRGHLDLLKSVDAKRWQVYKNVRLPNAIPYVFTGLKLALTISIIGAIVSEWVASNEGLGFLLLFFNSRLQTAHTFSVLAALVLVASSAFGVVLLLERRLSWQKRVLASGATAASSTTAPESGL